MASVFKPYSIARISTPGNKKFSQTALFYQFVVYNLPGMKELLKSLVQADTTTDKGELAAAEIIRSHLQDHGIATELACWDERRANVVVHIKSTSQRPALLFACHLDVVPPGEGQWKYPPFSSTEEDGRIFGRGSADMKGSIAALITAVEQFTAKGAELKGDIIIAAVAGEETDSCGIRKFVADYKEKLPPLTGVIIAEPTNFEVITAHRGLLWLEVVTKGRTAHGSMPHLGVNAINSMRLFLDEVEKINLSADKHPLLGDCSMSINTISGGKAVNVVPDLCSVKIDIRTIPDQSHAEIIEKFESVFSRLRKNRPEFDAEVKTVRNVGALETDSNCDFVKDFCSITDCKETITVGFCTDGPFLAGLGAPIVIFGPGDDKLAHKPDEYIELADLEKAVKVYTKFLARFSK
jgi:succinyl-diaminopimelate desuccinylase